ncbi:hypothetical protein AVEN_106683-1 [Araneus ventricosus]|uniref:Uncharacterized protein n=1 Tax=Araneus ventricosus TaxID=182803 RepID=A0A4Y2KG35_ARAVE|nr:hypothetical protein AVEN_106683-1 [Araneus ventricosus]
MGLRVGIVGQFAPTNGLLVSELLVLIPKAPKVAQGNRTEGPLCFEKEKKRLNNFRTPDFCFNKSRASMLEFFLFSSLKASFGEFSCIFLRNSLASSMLR